MHKQKKVDTQKWTHTPIFYVENGHTRVATLKMSPCTLEHTHTHTHKHTHTRARTHTHTHMHARMHKHTRTHTRTGGGHTRVATFKTSGWMLIPLSHLQGVCVSVSLACVCVFLSHPSLPPSLSQFSSLTHCECALFLDLSHTHTFPPSRRLDGFSFLSSLISWIHLLGVSLSL